MAVWVKLTWENNSIKCDGQRIEVSSDQQNWTGISYEMFQSGSTPVASDRTATINQTEAQTRTLYYRIGASYADNTKWSDPIAVEVTGTDDIVVAPSNVQGETIVD